jgi:hypothetical protein
LRKDVRLAKKSSNRYVELLNLKPESAWETIIGLSSDLSGQHHQVRSAILDIHAWVESEIRHFLFFYMRGMILYKDKSELEEKSKLLKKNIDRQMFGQIWRNIEHAVVGSPWPDLLNINEINLTRNQVAHGSEFAKIKYRGRNPFFEVDCFANLYFDAWAISQSMLKLFHKSIEESIMNLQYYRAACSAYKEKFGDLDFEFKYQSPFK